MKNWTKLVWVKLGWLSMNQDAARLKSTLYDTPETRRWHRLHGPVVTKCAMSKCSTDLFCTPSSMWPIGDDPHHGHPLPRCIHSPVRMVCNQEKLTFIRIQYILQSTCKTRSIAELTLLCRRIAFLPLPFPALHPSECSRTKCPPRRHYQHFRPTWKWMR